MSDERDDLAELIWGVEAEELGTFKTGVTSQAAERIADTVLAAGYRKVLTRQVVKELAANVWDEGHEEGWLNHESGLTKAGGRKRNPYRSQQ